MESEQESFSNESREQNSQETNEGSDNEDRKETVDKKISELENIEDSQEAVIAKKEREYESKIEDIEDDLGQKLKPESKEKIYKNTVTESVEDFENQKVEYNKLISEKTVLDNIDDDQFRERINPLDPDSLSEEDFIESFNELVEENSEVSKQERAELFREAVEYYSNFEEDEDLLMHSTSSFSLRKGLEEGFTGGKVSGGEKAREASSEKEGKPLSVSYLNNPTAEGFQQMWARLNAKQYEDLIIDSEEITNKSLPENFYNNFAEKLSSKEKRELLAKRENLRNKSEVKEKFKEIAYNKFEEDFGKEKGEEKAKEYFNSDKFKEFVQKHTEKIKPEEISEEELEKAFSKEKIKELVKDFESRDYSPPFKKIKDEILENIEDIDLKKELEQEAKDPFPCIITFNGKEKSEELYSKQKGEKPTHIPFEDHFYGEFNLEDIEEIRVPKKEIKKVKKWVQDKSIDINIVPLEVYEAKRLIQEKNSNKENDKQN